MKVHQHGFTLIELVIVIIVLGILSATALPKFLNLSDDAEIAVVEGTAGALKSAVNLAHSKWVIMGSSTVVALNNDVQLYGVGAAGQIDFTEDGWPAQSFVGPETKIETRNVADCASLWNTILNTGSSKLELNGDGEEFTAFYGPVVDAGEIAGVCLYKRTDNQALYIRYNSNNGSVTTFP